MLVFFEAGLRRDIIRELKSNFMRYPRFVKPTFGATTLLMDEKPVKLPTLFILLFKNYYSYKIKTKYRSSLINSWCLNRLLRMKNYLPRRLFFLNKSQYFDLGKRLPRVKNFNYIQQKRVDLLKLQYFYCFKKLSTVRRFLYKIEYSRSTWHYKYGLSSMLVHMLFRLNLFPNIKFCYTAIKLGFVLLNGLKTTNPFKSVVMLDTISIQPTFIKFVFRYFLKRLRKYRLLVNIPSFFDYDYRTMRFHIWRDLTVNEQYFSYEYPFQRPVNYDYPTIKLQPITYRRKF